MAKEPLSIDQDDRPVTNIFFLYDDRPGWQQATREIDRSVLMAAMTLEMAMALAVKTIRDCLDKHQKLGAADTMSREAVVGHLEKNYNIPNELATMVYERLY